VDHNIQVIIRGIPAIMAVQKNISNNIDVENIIDIIKSKSDQLYLCNYTYFFIEYIVFCCYKIIMQTMILFVCLW